MHAGARRRDRSEEAVHDRTLDCFVLAARADRGENLRCRDFQKVFPRRICKLLHFFRQGSTKFQEKSSKFSDFILFLSILLEAV